MKIGGEGVEQNFDDAVFDGFLRFRCSEDNFAKVAAVVLFAFQDLKADGFAVEVGELGGHVVVVIEEASEGFGNVLGGDPFEPCVGKVRLADDEGEFGREGRLGGFHTVR